MHQAILEQIKDKLKDIYWTKKQKSNNNKWINTNINLSFKWYHDKVESSNHWIYIGSDCGIFLFTLRICRIADCRIYHRIYCQERNFWRNVECSRCRSVRYNRLCNIICLICNIRRKLIWTLRRHYRIYNRRNFQFICSHIWTDLLCNCHGNYRSNRRSNIL